MQTELETVRKTELKSPLSGNDMAISRWLWRDLFELVHITQHGVPFTLFHWPQPERRWSLCCDHIPFPSWPTCGRPGGNLPPSAPHQGTLWGGCGEGARLFCHDNHVSFLWMWELPLNNKKVKIPMLVLLMLGPCGHAMCNRAYFSPWQMFCRLSIL